MTKRDLKTGHIVENRRGERALVIRDTVFGGDHIVYSDKSWTGLDGFSDDLIWHKNDRVRDFAKTVDIVRVYKPRLGTDCLAFPTFQGTSALGSAELIWERNECTEMTIEEIESKLGIYNLKVVK